MREKLEQYPQHYIINPKLFIKDPSIIDKYGITGLIMDESAVLLEFNLMSETLFAWSKKWIS